MWLYMARLVRAPVVSEPSMGVVVCASLSLCPDAAVGLAGIAPGTAMAPNIALCPAAATFTGIMWSCLRLSVGQL